GPIPGDLGHEADGLPIRLRARTHTTGNLGTPVSLICMSLNCGRKPENSEETHQARGEHANSMHTDPRRESNPYYG
ncbi:Uncharacterized protein DAT39_009336, partial [Clarias magur]